MEIVNDLSKFIHLDFSWPRSKKWQIVKPDGYAVYLAKNGRACELDMWIHGGSDNVLPALQQENTFTADEKTSTGRHR